MKEYHKRLHAFQTTRQYNNIVTSNDVALISLQNKSLDGDDLSATIDTLKVYVCDSCDTSVKNFLLLNQFMEKTESYDLTLYSNKSLPQIATDKISSDKFCSDLTLAIASPNIKDLTKLATIVIANPIDYITPVVLETGYHYATMMNDWIDACAYCLHGINERDGTLHKLDDEQIKSYVRGCLSQFQNLSGYKYPFELSSDVDLMTNVKDYVLSRLDTEDFETLAKYIDDNVEKIPMLRRTWVSGY